MQLNRCDFFLKDKLLTHLENSPVIKHMLSHALFFMWIFELKLKITWRKFSLNNMRCGRWFFRCYAMIHKCSGLSPLKYKINTFLFTYTYTIIHNWC